jgi:hypothetical protein
MRYIFVGQSTLGRDGAHHFRRPLGPLERAVRVRDRPHIRSELRRAAAAHDVGQHLDSKIGERAHQRQEENNENPGKHPAASHRMDDAKDLEKNRPDEENIAQCDDLLTPGGAYQATAQSTS